MIRSEKKKSVMAKDGGNDEHGTLHAYSQRPHATATMAKKRKPQPLAPPPQSALRSRKRARQVTTLFHKYSQQLDAALARARSAGCKIDGGPRDVHAKKESTSAEEHALLEEVKKWDNKLKEIGGREEYQRASQMNTSLFSTSKWVLGVLGKWGWLDGLPIEHSQTSNDKSAKKSKSTSRRDTRLLEIGAINTQLLDAAARTRLNSKQDDKTERVHRLDVQAIDIRSTDDRIQQIDFFDYPLPKNDTAQNNAICSSQVHAPYDVLVNSMVINCVTSPEQRGKMLSLCYQQLRPGGVLFLILPKLCLKQSKFMTCMYFEQILKDGLGFELLDECAKDSPKLAFYVLRRPAEVNNNRIWRDGFGCMKVLNNGKKFRNEFGVILSKDFSSL